MAVSNSHPSSAFQAAQGNHRFEGSIFFAEGSIFFAVEEILLGLRVRVASFRALNLPVA
jgi:hypothetical protein